MLRILDFVLSAVGLILTAPLLLIIFVIAWLDTRSPLFLQQRVGRRQRPFTLVKFRSMWPDSPSVATHLSSAYAVTPFGHFLRRSKLDELPQLWNVLLGQMSLVGPRPCLLTQTEVVEARQLLGVFEARPGVTGLAQLRGVDMSTPEALASLDAEMLRNLTPRSYASYVLQTALGGGAGDRIRS
jgi:O-antigen biosynthesis protein WbqP